MSQAAVAPTARRPGPERSTLVGRIVELVPLPYTLSCVAIATLIGPPGTLVVGWVTGGSLDAALGRFFAGYMPPTTWQVAASLGLWWLAYAALLWLVRHHRQHVVDAEAPLSRILPGGRGDYRATFGPVADTGPALLVGAGLMLVSTEFVIGVVAGGDEVLWQVFNIVRLSLFYLAAGTLLWSYIAGLSGLAKVGQRELQLVPLEEDSLQGTRAAGELALGLAVTYFGVLALLGLTVLIAPAIPVFAPTLIALSILGLALFFLPLWRIHCQMEAAKQRRLKAIRTAVLDMAAPVLRRTSAEREPGAHHESSAAGHDEGRSQAALAVAFGRMTDLQALDAADRKLSAAPEWPFDTDILSALAAVMLPIVLAILTDLARGALGF